MFRVINEYMAKVNLVANDEIYTKLNNFLKSLTEIKSYTITVNFQRYVIDIRMNEFSVDNTTKLFNKFNSVNSYPYSSLYVRFNEGKCVRYRYLTSKEDKSGLYCDIIFS